MSGRAKFIIGLVASLLASWLYIGPLGNGGRFVAALETQARSVVAAAKIEGVDVRMAHSPLKRVAILSGPADEFQRFGMGSLKGVTQRVEDVKGIARAEWVDRPPSGFVLPLIAESLLAAAIAYLLGLGFGWLLWRRRDDAG
jgi:hypothetical protein